MGTYRKLTSKPFNLNLKEMALKLGYAPENICILDGNINELQMRFPSCHLNLESCSHAMDSRSMIEYGRDLVANWIIEDTIVKNLRDAGLQVHLSGGDKNRRLLNQIGVSSNSDCKVIVNGIERNLELVTNYTDYWMRKKQIDLRDSKFKKLVREKAILLGIMFSVNKYIVIDFSSNNLESEYIPSHEPWGGKPATAVKLSDSMFKPLGGAKLIASDIKKMCNAKYEF